MIKKIRIYDTYSKLTPNATIQQTIGELQSAESACISGEWQRLELVTELDPMEFSTSSYIKGYRPETDKEYSKRVENIYKHLGNTYEDTLTNMAIAIFDYVDGYEQFPSINNKFICVVWNNENEKKIGIVYAEPEVFNKEDRFELCSLKEDGYLPKINFSKLKVHCKKCNIPLPDCISVEDCYYPLQIGFTVKEVPVSKNEKIVEEKPIKEKQVKEKAVVVKQNVKEKTHYKKSLEELNKQRAIARMFSGAKKRASEKMLEFNISERDIIIPEECPIMKVPFRYDAGLDPMSPSLDRVDSTKGYIKGNVQVISHRANALKSNMSTDDLIALGKYVENNLN